MSDTTGLTSDQDHVAAPQTRPDAAATRRRRSGSGLSGMLLTELQRLASSLGISGVGRMRKGELVAAIQLKQSQSEQPADQVGQVARPQKGTDVAERDIAHGSASTVSEAGGFARPFQRMDAQSGGASVRADASAVSEPRQAPAEVRESQDVTVRQGTVGEAGTESATTSHSVVRRATRPAGPPAANPSMEAGTRSGSEADTPSAPERSEPTGEERPRDDRRERSRRRATSGDDESTEAPAARRDDGDQSSQRDRGENGREQRGDSGRDQRDGGRDQRDQRDQRDRNNDDDGDGSGRRRRGRYRDRRKRGDRGGEGEPVVTEDDVLVPVAGILDVLDNYAFVRTSGYLAGPNDVYVSMSQIRKYGLRRGDAITGAVRANREGENRRDKYNPLVRLDTINGMDPEEAKRRPEFYKLTPLYPQDRLRLETEPHQLTTRVIDLITPIGKGQRALIVSPPKAGKTMVLQAIANAITRNNPECHLMVVLVDERPEEVTDMQRSVKGEVIAATFDRPPSDHTTVAELAIERAKRLVEMGHDVVVLLDSVTRLGRSYNLAAPASGRILSGGIDSTALYPPKRFLGAARNIENGGSLTILATALVETGSTMDTVIFEEFKGTGNSELKLDRKIADRRVWPAVDVNASSTRKEEILLSPEELVIVHKLRRVLGALDPQQALDLLLDRLKQNKTNIEFLMQIAKTTPGE
ncbi:MAG TPA: transcription termination factor Rho [Micromonosporaceae bacterium]